MTSRQRDRADHLRQRRQDLLTRSRAQRAALGSAWTGLEPSLLWVDLAWRTVRRLRRRPWLLALPVLAFVWLRPRGLGRFAAVAPLLLRLCLGGSTRNPC